MTPRHHVARALLAVLVLCLPGGRDGTAGPRTPQRPPTLVLVFPDGRERMVEADDFKFASFERLYTKKSASREESLERQRVVIEDRRQDCRCIRFEDWTRVKFKKLRQIEIVYPEGSRLAVLRLTRRDGQVNELSAGTLFGAGDPFPPRFGATIDGLYQEFPLILEDSVEGGWPEETLSRILLVTSPPPRQKRSGRR